jgi:hypothetical protein
MFDRRLGFEMLLLKAKRSSPSPSFPLTCLHPRKYIVQSSFGRRALPEDSRGITILIGDVSLLIYLLGLCFVERPENTGGR